jgi:hypothetical protein
MDNDLSKVDSMDADIFKLTNIVRKNPKCLIPDLEELLSCFEVGLDNQPGFRMKRHGRSTLMTKEGPKAVKDAIEYLKSRAPVPELKWSNEMAKCPKAHAQHLGMSGDISHQCSKGRGTKERLRDFGNVIGCYGENISVFCNTAKEVIL